MSILGTGTCHQVCRLYLGNCCDTLLLIRIYLIIHYAMQITHTIILTPIFPGLSWFARGLLKNVEQIFFTDARRPDALPGSQVPMHWKLCPSYTEMKHIMLLNLPIMMSSICPITVSNNLSDLPDLTASINSNYVQVSHSFMLHVHSWIWHTSCKATL